MRKRMAMGAAALALAAVGGLAGMSLAGAGGPSGPAIERPVADPVVLEPVTATARTGQAQSQRARARGKRKKKKPVIDFYYQAVPLEPGFVQPIRCPRKAGNPIAGGARTSIGIVISYLSRINPQTNARPARTYYVGVDALPDAHPDANAFIEVQCAKGLKVKR